MMTITKLKSLASQHNGTFKRLDRHDHEGNDYGEGRVAVFEWDDEDDSDAMMEEEDIPDVLTVTHEHNERKVLESRVAFSKPIAR
jgi:hypothetical protein